MNVVVIQGTPTLQLLPHDINRCCSGGIPFLFCVILLTFSMVSFGSNSRVMVLPVMCLINMCMVLGKFLYVPLNYVLNTSLPDGHQILFKTYGANPRSVDNGLTTLTPGSINRSKCTKLTCALKHGRLTNSRHQSRGI